MAFFLLLKLPDICERVYWIITELHDIECWARTVFYVRAILRAKFTFGHIKIVHFGEKGTVHLVQNAEVIKKSK